MPRTRPKKREWKSAIDPKSGKRYYYDIHTRQTQWQKPLELASSTERRLIQEKELKQRRFFQAMEKNILKSMQSGKLPGEKKMMEEDRVESLPKGNKGMAVKGTIRPKLFRTISSMDDELLQELTNVNVGDASSSPKSNEITSSVSTPSPSISTSFFDSLPQPGYGPSIHSVPSLSHVSTSSSSSFDNENEESSSPLSLSSPKLVKALPKPNLSKRNTCGTMYVASTMAAPDKDAAIKCVCGVYRTHILQSIKEEKDHPSQRTKFAEYEIFNDIDTSSSTHTTPSKPKSASIVENDFGIELQFEEDDNHHHTLPIPSLDEITDYFRYIFNKAQLENDCIIMSLIYVERLLRETNGGVRPRLENWKSLLFSCMIMASKVWDDLSMWNVDFSQACPSNVSFSLKRINELELAILSCLNYSVKVPASAYAKYYFLMRSMLIRSGLAGDEFRASKPLDMEGAKKLEFLTSEYKAKPVMKSSMRRSKSLGGDEGVKSPTAPKQVKLEQVVHM